MSRSARIASPLRRSAQRLDKRARDREINYAMHPWDRQTSAYSDESECSSRSLSPANSDSRSHHKLDMSRVSRRYSRGRDHKRSRRRRNHSVSPTPSPRSPRSRRRNLGKRRDVDRRRASKRRALRDLSDTDTVSSHSEEENSDSVSYTHLTLPTILLV